MPLVSSRAGGHLILNKGHSLPGSNPTGQYGAPGRTPNLQSWDPLSVRVLAEKQNP